MANLYLILDTTHANYGRFVRALHSKVNTNFKPRLSADGTKALIQVKSRYLARTITERENIRSFVLGSGDAAWARTQVKRVGWKMDEAELDL